MKNITFLICLSSLVASVSAQNANPSPFQELQKLEAKAKAGVTTEYSIRIDGSDDLIYGRIYLIDKKLRIDEVSAFKDLGKIVEPVINVSIIDLSSSPNLPIKTSSTFSFQREFSSPSEILDIIRDEPHPRSATISNAPAGPYTPILRRYGRESRGWLSELIKPSDILLSQVTGNKALLRWTEAGQVEKSLEISLANPKVVSGLFTKPLAGKTSSFKGSSFAEENNKEGIFRMTSLHDYSESPTEIKAQAIKDLELGSDAKLTLGETIKLEKEVYGSIDDTIFQIQPNENSIFTDYQSGYVTKVKDGKSEIISNIFNQEPEEKSGVSFWFGLGGVSLTALLGAALFRRRLSK